MDFHEAEAALFDLDGTLVDTEPRSRWAWSRLFDGYGVPLSEPTLAGFAGRRGYDVLAERLSLFPGRTAEELFAETMAYWWSAAAPGIAAVPGAVELVRQVHRSGTPLAIVSSGRRTDVAAMLGELAVYELFDVIVTAEDVSRGKPDPQGYLIACERLGRHPRRTVIFEDAPAGVTAAKTIGARCVAVTTTSAATELVDADLVVADLSSVSWPLGGGTRRR
ncbi:HAD family hydrolase [Nocardia arthritidis]|uniref:HAD-IA family hydrolase n=1 Tax=Nocardia arthritidis TaxID=228602 RepID=A0A6G9YN93_9NOCA|nr:HAD family phosphatase [Nocardia arthritidis]QIS14506.1 HAD-IA family hydrolase [Nocardia arthritidis]